MRAETLVSPPDGEVLSAGAGVSVALFPTPAMGLPPRRCSPRMLRRLAIHARLAKIAVSRGAGMPKYLFQASYTPQGIAGVRAQGGSSRRDAVAATAEGLGGSVESFYFAFGDSDVF